VWSALPDGTVDFVNPYWGRFTGLLANDALGWKWQSVVHPEDVETFTSAWRSSLQSLDPLEQEIRVHRHDGTYRWWLIRCTPAFNKHGEVLKWYGSGFDIDDHKRVQEELRHQDEMIRDRAEQELRDTIDAIPVLCGTLSSGGNVEFFNQRTLDYYGLKADQMIGFNWKDVVHAQDLPRLVAVLGEAMSSGHPVEVETRNRRADGEYRWLLHPGPHSKLTPRGQFAADNSLRVRAYRITQSVLCRDL
jgi:PAS domain S-box-containing protein